MMHGPTNTEYTNFIPHEMILHMAILILLSVPERKERTTVIHGDVGYFPEASPSRIFSLYSRRQCSKGEVRV
jgi:hypothetical protein